MGTTPIVYVEDTRPTMHYGDGAPTEELGVDGDTYLDVPGTRLYGPKAAGVWGSGVSLQGPQGEPGAAGQTGASGSTAAVPIGALVPFTGLTAPTGYLFAAGQAVSRTTYSDLFTAITALIGVATVSIATPGVVSYVAHGLVDGDGVYLTSTGALPTGLSVDTSYYVVNATANTFQLAASRGGAAINTTGSQSGTHTLFKAPWGGVTASNFGVPDMRGRVGVGVDNMGGTDGGTLTVANALGATGGTQTHTLTTAEMPVHTHVQDAHTHVQITGGNITTVAPSAGTGVIGQTNTTNTQSTTATNQNAGSGNAHNNMQPYALVNWLIKT